MLLLPRAAVKSSSFGPQRTSDACGHGVKSMKDQSTGAMTLTTQEKPYGKSKRNAPGQEFRTSRKNNGRPERTPSFRASNTSTKRIVFVTI